MAMKATTAPTSNAYRSGDGTLYYIPNRPNGLPLPYRLRVCTRCGTVWNDVDFTWCVDCHGIGVIVNPASEIQEGE